MGAQERNSVGGVANHAVPPGSQATRHHRHKRFHVRPEALGRGYRVFDFAPAPAPSPPVEPVPEVLSEPERVQKAAFNGIQICLTLLGCIGFCLYVYFAHPEWITKLWTWLPPKEPKPPGL
jgi:hypothetical protein